MDDGASGVERALFGLDDLTAIRAVLDAFAVAHLDSGIGRVLFRAGRIDSVWAVELTDGRQVVIKAHRPPTDLTQVRLATRAQRLLTSAGFPCPTPLTEPQVFHGVVLSAEDLIDHGTIGDRSDPRVRQAMARGLADHVAVLSDDPTLVDAVGPGPAWCRYQDGPWPTPHDSIFDFRTTPVGYEWLDRIAADAAERLASPVGRRVVGHDDWCLGNVRFVDAELVATFDWGLVNAVEPALAGFAAAGHTDDSGSEPSAPTPDQVRAFLADYDSVIPTAFSPDEQHVAAAAATWTLAYNARCQLNFMDGADPDPGTALALLHDHHADYLRLCW